MAAPFSLLCRDDGHDQIAVDADRPVFLGTQSILEEADCLAARVSMHHPHFAGIKVSTRPSDATILLPDLDLHAT